MAGGLRDGPRGRSRPSAVAGTAIDIILKPFAPTEQARRKWPHRVIIVVEPADVTIYASNRHGIQGGKLVRFQAGEFKADLDHYPGEIDLTFESLEGKSYWVRGSWGPIRRSCSRAAHAAIRLSSGSAQPEIGVHESERRRHPEMP